MKILAFAIALLMICLALTGLFWPEGLTRIGQYSFTSTGLYVVALIRLAVGLVFFLAAPASRAPRTLRILGVIVCVAGLGLAVISIERAHAVMDWWLTHALGFIRVAAVVVLGVASFIVYATAPQRR
jgi:hypothetical protein